MAHIFNNNDDLSNHDMAAIIKGNGTQKKFTFFGAPSEKPGQNEKVKEYRGGSYPKADGEERIPSNKVCKNPMLKAPNVRDQKFFGALPIFKIAIDQLLPKPVGVFSVPTSGAGASVSQIMNAVTGGEDKLFNIVSKQLFGSVIDEASHQFQSLDNIVKNVGGLIGADANTIISAVAPDELVKLMQGMSTGLSNIDKFASSNNAFENIQNTFDTSVFNDGITMAKEVNDYIKKYYL